MHGPLKYNEDKVKKGVACLLGTFNVPGGGMPENYAAVFKRLERRNGRTQDISFQMSINPAPDRPNEMLTDDEALSYAKRVMDGLGYKDQPIVVYKHFDIERVHYHVVSIRTNEKGRKIKDSFEERKLLRLMEQYATMYHYIVGNKGIKVVSTKDSATTRAQQEQNPTRKLTIPRYNPKAGDIRKQIDNIFDVALDYEFTTWNQFKTIAKSMRLGVDYFESNSSYSLSFQGLDSKGSPASPFITETTLGNDYYSRYEERIRHFQKKVKYSWEEQSRRRYEKIRAAKIVSYCQDYAKTERHLEMMLAKKGITMSLSRSEDGSLFGATFVDHKSKRVFKLSELDRTLKEGDLITPRIKAAATPKTGTWAVNEEEYMQKWIESKRAERQEAHIQQLMDMAALQAGQMGDQQKNPSRKDSHVAREYLPGEIDYLAAGIKILNSLLKALHTGMSTKQSHHFYPHNS